MSTNADDTLAAFDAMLARVRAAGPQVVAKQALALQAAGMALTRVRRGTLRRSWRVELRGNEAQVGPTVVYARRIELGFLPPLSDSLGRQFPRAVPHPYVKPAFEATAPKLGGVAVSVLARAIGG